MTNYIDREKVYAAIDLEREYQEIKWNPDNTSSGGKHEVGSYILFMEDYLQEARSKISRKGDPEASYEALDVLRKVVALGVACMEQHGVVFRT